MKHDGKGELHSRNVKGVKPFHTNDHPLTYVKRLKHAMVQIVQQTHSDSVVFGFFWISLAIPLPKLCQLLCNLGFQATIRRRVPTRGSHVIG